MYFTCFWSIDRLFSLTWLNKMKNTMKKIARIDDLPLTGDLFESKWGIFGKFSVESAYDGGCCNLSIRILSNPSQDKVSTCSVKNCDKLIQIKPFDASNWRKFHKNVPQESKILLLLQRIDIDLPFLYWSVFLFFSILLLTFQNLLTIKSTECSCFIDI